MEQEKDWKNQIDELSNSTWTNEFKGELQALLKKNEPLSEEKLPEEIIAEVVGEEIVNEE
jgi:hypothetical protein